MFPCFLHGGYAANFSFSEVVEMEKVAEDGLNREANCLKQFFHKKYLIKSAGL
jgi:hypothetical protein